MRSIDSNWSSVPPGSTVLGFRQFRREITAAPSEQRKRFRFRHKRQQYHVSLETRWATAAST
jgi:hypothetical protein